MAGAGYKLFNTGDVLTAAQVNTYLMEQSVMVFADAAARTTALSGVVAEGMLSYLKDTNAVEVYDGANWVASDDPNAIQNTIVDAKGDLVAASADNVPARLAVGNNGETLVADSSATTGLRWQEPKAQQCVINSAFQVWQRGTSFTSTDNAYTADRWQVFTGASTTSTVSRQTTSDTTNLPNIQYALRYQRNSGQTGTAVQFVAQSLESVDSIPFAGKIVTLSFYARKGADYSAASSALAVVLRSGTGTNQNILSGFTGANSFINQTATLTTTWQRFTYTGTVPTTATQLGVQFTFTPVGTASTNDYFEITGVQVEAGSVATPFRTYSATLAGELAACQRYYYRWTAGSSYSMACFTTARGSNNSDGILPAPVTMRANPTSVDFANLLAIIAAGGGASSAVSTMTLYQVGPSSLGVTVQTAGNLGAQGAALQIIANNNSGAFFGFSAEL